MPYVNIKGNNWFYEIKFPDNLEPILMVHGHPFNHTMWQYQYDTLKDYKLILPDLLGYGKSDYKFEYIYIEDQAFDLAFLLEHILEINSVHLIGLSMGAQIIIEFARMFPQKCKSLTICAGNPAAETKDSYKNRMNLIDRIHSDGMQKYTREDIHKYLHPNTIINNKDVYEHLNQMMCNTNIQGALASHRGRAERVNNYTFLSSINIPTLVISGDKDFFHPQPEMADIAAEIKGSKFSLVKDAGHMVNMEQPTIFNNVLMNFYRTRFPSTIE